MFDLSNFANTLEEMEDSGVGEESEVNVKKKEPTPIASRRSICHGLWEPPCNSTIDASGCWTALVSTHFVQTGGSGK